jgi:hypothetical protein
LQSRKQAVWLHIVLFCCSFAATVFYYSAAMFLLHSDSAVAVAKFYQRKQAVVLHIVLFCCSFAATVFCYFVATAALASL